MKTMTSWLVVAVAIAPIQPAFAQDRAYGGDAHVHYAKTEVEKATSRCTKSVIGAGLLGALVGAAAGGARGAAIGVGGGALVGTGICAVMMANAKHKDRIIAAELAAASSGSPVTQRWDNDKGQSVAFTATRGDEQGIDGARLIPVRYQLNGSDAASPLLASGQPAMCRKVEASFDNGQKMPAQTFCRTPAGDYAPYEVRTA